MISSAESKAAIALLIEKYGSIEELYAAAPTIRELADFLSQAKPSFVANSFDIIFKRLTDVDRWHTLAASPKEFDKRLEELLRIIKRLMKMTYGASTPRHRPVKNASRDAMIWKLKIEHAELSWEQIAQKCNKKMDSKLNGNGAERAFKRTQERKKNELKSSLELIADALEWRE